MSNELFELTAPVVGSNWRDLFNPEWQERGLLYFDQLLHGSAPKSIRLRMGSGRRELLVHLGGVGGEQLLIVATRSHPDLQSYCAEFLEHAAFTAAILDATKLESAQVADQLLEARSALQVAEDAREHLCALQDTIDDCLCKHGSADDLLLACVRAIVAHLGAVLACIWIRVPGTEMLELRASAGLRPELQGREQFIRIGQFHVGRIVENNRAHVSNTFSLDRDTIDSEWAKRDGLVGFAGYPLVVDGEVLGVIALFRRDQVKPDCTAALELVAVRCGQSLSRLDAIAALRSSRAQIHRMMEGSSDGYWDWHVPTGVVRFSPRLTEMLGYQAGDIGQDIDSMLGLIHPDDLSTVSRFLDQCFSGLVADYTIELRLRTAAHGWKWVLSRGKVSSWIEPNVPEWMSGTHSDIEQRRAAEEALALLLHRHDLIVEQSPLAMIDSDVDGTITGVNPAAEQLLGYSRLRAIGLPWSVLGLPPNQEGALLPQLSPTGERGLARVLSTRTADGGSLLCEWLNTAVTREDGSVMGVSSMCRDVTAMHKAEQELQKLWHGTSQSPLAVLLVDLNASIQYVNSRFEELSGYSAAEVLGKDLRTLLEFFEPPSPSIDEIWKTVFSGVVWQGELCKRRRSGEVFWEWAVLSPIRDAAGAVTGAIAFKDDVTVRKLMERELVLSGAKFKSVFDHMEDGYLAAVAGEHGTMVNPAAVRLLGYTESIELQAIFPLDLLAEEEQRSELHQQLQSVGEARCSQMRLRLQDGSVRVFEGHFRRQAGAQGESESVVLMFRDVTDRQRAERETRARMTADAANRLKGAFLANMSHEIRTPMHGVLGLTHLALQTNMTDQQRDYLTKIQQSSRNLLTIVNDILDFSKIEAGKLELEQLDFKLDEVLESLVSTVIPTSAAKGLELRLVIDPEVPAWLRGDRTRLGQVLLNLVSNAVKFTELGEVSVYVHPGPVVDHGICLCFSVSDSGIGIEPDSMSGLFSAFNQADSSVTRRFGGTGLGLAICKQLVTLMEGEISVESTRGQGSRFFFTAVFGSAVLPDGADYEQMVGLRALVVDDDKAARTALSDALSLLRMEVEELGSTAAAQAHLEDAGKTFHLLFLQERMPGALSSLELIRRVRRAAVLDGRAILIVVLADHADPSLTEQATLAGADSILFRPFTRSHLVDILVNVLHPQSFQSRRSQQPSVREALHEWKRVLRGVRVLAAEDHPINQQIARELLESVGAEVTFVGNGAEAVDTLLASGSSGRGFDLILMDLQMPIMDGYSATVVIRSDSRFGKIPILAMTAHVLSEERARCLDAGMQDYISKPIDPEAFFTTLARWVINRERAPEKLVAEPPLLFPLIANVNVRSGLLRVAGNTRLYRSLLLEFYRQRCLLAEEFQAAFHLEDSIQLGHLCHALSGVASNLGADSLAHRAVELGRRTATRADISACLALLLVELEEVGQSIAQALALAQDEGEKQQEAPVDERIVAKFTRQLQIRDGTAPDTLPAILTYFAGQNSRGELQELETLVCEYRYDCALVCLDELLDWGGSSVADNQLSRAQR